MRTDEVFGISPEVREASYVDRGELDSKLQRSLRRTKHWTYPGPLLTMLCPGLWSRVLFSGSLGKFLSGRNKAGLLAMLCRMSLAWCR